MQVYELSANYDSRASFYGKAQVIVSDDGSKTLQSYSTKVAIIKPVTREDLGRVESTDEYNVEVFGTYSQTTLRHIKEFLLQNGFKADNSKQIMADYGATK